MSIGGAETFLASLTKEFHHVGVDQHLISLSNRNPLAYAFDDNIAKTILARKNKFSIEPARKLRRIMKNERPQIIFCLNFFSYAFCRIASWGADTGSDYIISYHSTIHLNRKDHFLHKLYIGFLRRKDRVIMVSTNQAEYTSRKYHLDPKQISVIHNGVDTSYWHPPSTDFKKEKAKDDLGIPTDSPVIIMTASFRKEKNHIAAVEALQILHRQGNSKPYLLLIGDGETRKEVESASRGSTVSAYVKFTGAQKDVRHYLWCSDLFTLTSNGVETFSIAALEAMACGLPCVLTDIGGASEMVFSGINGELCSTDPIDIASKWSKVLDQRYSAIHIHEWIMNKFEKTKMIASYQEEMDIKMGNT
jgi:glycosyltransferase involved in cell wall biosynthesis